MYQTKYSYNVIVFNGTYFTYFQAANRSSQLPTPNAGPKPTIPLNVLSPYINKWTIKARVIQKSPIKTWSNSRSEGRLFSMSLVDASGEIRATAFKEECDKNYENIEVGKVYYISNGSLKPANVLYNTCNNDYEMTFEKSTVITPCMDETEASVPTIRFNFQEIGSLKPTMKNR